MPVDIDVSRPFILYGPKAEVTSEPGSAIFRNNFTSSLLSFRCVKT